MPVMDEFKEERASLKNASFKVKFRYFLDYYKWHVIAVVIIVAVVSSLIYNFVTKKETAFYAAFINSIPNNYTPTLDKDFAELIQIDQKKSEVLIDGTMYMDIDAYDQATVASMQKIMVYTSANDLDVMVTDVPVFDHFAYLDTMIDLRTILSPQEQVLYEPYYYYVDGRIMEEREEANKTISNTYTVDYPKDPFDPASMTNPIPVGIKVNDSELLTSNYNFREGPTVFGFVAGSKRSEVCKQFLDFLFTPEQPADVAE